MGSKRSSNDVVCKDANWPRGGTGRVEIRMRKEKKSTRQTAVLSRDGGRGFWLVLVLVLYE